MCYFYPGLKINQSPGSMQMKLIECGGAGLCGWLSVDYWLEQLPQLEMYDSKAELTREIQNGMLETHIVLTIVREILDKPKYYCNPNIFPIKEDAAFTWVLHHPLDQSNAAPAFTDSSLLVYRREVVAHFDTAHLRQWMCHQVLNKSVWFDEVWCLALNHLSSMQLNDTGLVLLTMFNGKVMAQQFATRASNIFIMNCSNTHWVAVDFVRGG